MATRGCAEWLRRADSGFDVRPTSRERKENMPRDSLKRRRSPRIDVESIKPQVEKAVLGFGFLNPMLALPQIYNIFALKHVAGLSVITVASALVMSLLWMAYGALSRQMVVWATSAVWVILNGAILVGLAMFAR